MQKRRYPRIKRRFPCEIIVNGTASRGIVTDLSAGGLFVQTHEALSPGEEVEVRLGGSAASDGIVLRAQVRRARRVPQRLAAVEKGGVGLLVEAAPPEFYELLAKLADPSSASAPPKPKPASKPAAAKEPPKPAAPRKPTASLRAAARLARPKPPPEPKKLTSAFCYRVQAKQVGGARTRTVIAQGATHRDAKAQAARDLGNEWEVLAVKSERLLRVKTQFEFGSSAASSASGTLVDVSFSSALFEAVDFQPEVGTEVKCRVFPYGDTQPVTLSGRVVLKTDRGFAIDQQVTDDAAREFVAAVASLDD